MENNSAEQSKYDFLADNQVQRYFSELNIELLKGVHIRLATPYLFHLLDEFYNEFEGFYKDLYGLRLEKRTHDNCTYFYLAVPEGSKGRLSYPGLYKELEDRQVIIGFVLCALYVSKYFYADKKFHWDDIRYEIEHGENKDAYLRLFFKDARAERTEEEWDKVKEKFEPVINFFGRIGLIEKDVESDELQFTILPTIYRFIEMYNDEIQNIEELLKENKS
jgi:chromosome condensin MukBEF MukE localization factor